MKFLFWLQINIKDFFKLMLSFSACVTRQAEITQNKSLLFLYNIIRKNWVMKLIFCMQVTMKVSYRLMLWFLMGMFKHSQSTQNNKLAISLQYLKENKKNEVVLLLADKKSTISSNWYYHSRCVARHEQTIRKNKFAICNILKAHCKVWYNFWQLKALQKMMKNDFYFTLWYLNFCLDFLVM